MNSTEIVLQFLERINRHNADELAELKTDDHVFIDSLGNSVSGREPMRQGWRGYYAFCPDYWVSHEVVILGAAGGTIAADGGK